jgi:hypothetical protein
LSGSEEALTPQSYELKLSDGKVEVVQKGTGQEPPYSIHQMGVYLVVETDVGLVLLWDRRTSIFLRLGPEFKVRQNHGGHCHCPCQGPEGHTGWGKNRETVTGGETERQWQEKRERERYEDWEKGTETETEIDREVTRGREAGTEI